ncbi:hypothetical protein NDU88_003824 [Pleurodeles waltl]|uniref:Uncharacterized protein n=1 Tax=Pleurodeles waltl TaxID=8319 RepID=A0AAV7VH30_PLEWA|nr:hypothetical protein NDU88_003824 [Pleurodeles waltl]
MHATSPEVSPAFRLQRGAGALSPTAPTHHYRAHEARDHCRAPVTALSACRGFPGCPPATRCPASHLRTLRSARGTAAGYPRSAGTAASSITGVLIHVSVLRPPS